MKKLSINTTTPWEWPFELHSDCQHKTKGINTFINILITHTHEKNTPNEPPHICGQCYCMMEFAWTLVSPIYRDCFKNTFTYLSPKPPNLLPPSFHLFHLSSCVRFNVNDFHTNFFFSSFFSLLSSFPVCCLLLLLLLERKGREGQVYAMMGLWKFTSCYWVSVNTQEKKQQQRE